MNISDSDLFKSFSRPVLQQDDKAPRRCIMDRVIQALINCSSVEVSAVSISNATTDSYVISIQCRVTGTGPVSSTVSAMELDLTFNGFPFGKVALPEIKTSFWGTKVVVKSQEISITDMAIFKAFVRSVIVDDETSFRLENGPCTITALGISANCTYSLGIPIKGMAGPRAVLTKLQRVEKGITATIRIHNPSPVAMDHGDCIFDLRNQQGEAMAELRGHLRIVPGSFDYLVRGTRREGVEATQKARLVGVGEQGKTWCNETIHYIDTMVDLSPEFAAILGGMRD